MLFDLPEDGEKTMPAALAIAPTHAGPYDEALRKLQAANPVHDARRWDLAKQDAAAFLADWGDRAAELGWTADDLFGLHPLAPLARYDVMGLIWSLQGGEVRGLAAGYADLGATRFYRTER